MPGLHFNPRSPCGERQILNWNLSKMKIFQSTLPLRGATQCPDCLLRHLWDFNPRSPCGERPWVISSTTLLFRISIHAPLAGSDCSCFPLRVVTEISIHAPLAGSDHPAHLEIIIGHDFNPRSPCGERRWITEALRPPIKFQSTLPLRGATGRIKTFFSRWGISIHAPLAGSDVNR